MIHHDLITSELTQSTWLLGDGLLILDSFPRRCVLSRDKMLLSCVPRFWPTPLVSTLAWGEDESRRNNKYDLSDSFSSGDQKAQTHLPEGCPEQGMGRRVPWCRCNSKAQELCPVSGMNRAHFPVQRVPEIPEWKIHNALEMSAFVVSLSPLLAEEQLTECVFSWGCSGKTDGESDSSCQSLEMCGGISV